MEDEDTQEDTRQSISQTFQWLMREYAEFIKLNGRSTHAIVLWAALQSFQ